MQGKGTEIGGENAWCLTFLLRSHNKGFFDKVVDITQSKCAELIMIPWVILVIADGAFFFFLLVGVPAGNGRSVNSG